MMPKLSVITTPILLAVIGNYPAGAAGRRDHGRRVHYPIHRGPLGVFNAINARIHRDQAAVRLFLVELGCGGGRADDQQRLAVYSLGPKLLS